MSNNKKIVYLDNSATTRPYDEVIDSVYLNMKNNYGNPSSKHILGVEAERLLNNARLQAASVIGAENIDVFFTSGGTEANNIAILGALGANKRNGNKIITSSIEHPSVLSVFEYLKTKGYDTSYIPVDKNGIIDLEFLKNEIDDNTSLISCMLVNNEVGTIEPCSEIKNIIKNKNIIFHIDAVQAYGKIDFNIDDLGADLLTISGHKIHAPKGVGALFVKKGIKIAPVIFGGGQEKDIRSGTQNVCAIAGLLVATQITKENLRQNIEKTKQLKTRLYDGIIKNIDDIVINSPGFDISSPHILNVSFLGTKSEILLHMLENEGIMVSSGSACSSNKPAKSKVLTNMGKGEKIIDSSLRFSLSHTNTFDEMDYTIEKLIYCVSNLRKTLRRWKAWNK